MTDTSPRTPALVRINSVEIHPIVIRGQRVLTLAQVDKVHGRPEGTARRNFNENKNRLIEGQEYFIVSSDEIRTNSPDAVSAATKRKDMVVLTESGYLLLVKSFTDDLAWQVQRELVNAYFRVHTPTTPTPHPRPERTGEPLIVPFKGVTLQLIDHQGDPFVVMRPIVEALGLAWGIQRIKLKSWHRSHLLSLGTASDVRERASLCLALRRFDGWLMGINPRLIHPHRDPLFRALRDHGSARMWASWTDTRALTPPSPPPAPVRERTAPARLPSEVRAAVHRRAHALSLGQYDRLCEALTEAVLQHLEHFPNDRDPVAFIERMGSPTSELVVVSREDLWRVTSRAAVMAAFHEAAMTAIHDLETLTGRPWYGR